MRLEDGSIRVNGIQFFACVIAAENLLQSLGCSRMKY